MAVFAGPGGKELLDALLLTAYLVAAGYLALILAAYHFYRKRRIAERRIRHLAHYDTLTELPNRALLAERTAAAIEGARRGGRAVALLFLDLDRFKQVNDSLGHVVGDELLRGCARRLVETLGAAGVVGRQGGDEFVLLLPDLADAEAAAGAARKVVEAMRQPFALGTRELLVSCSAGVALCPQNGEDFDTLLRNADTAMYAAKEAGRDCFRFHAAEMTRRVKERLELEGDLHRALQAGELAVALQPQVTLADGALCGMEALVRWSHPRRGAIGPAQFIPVAEDCGLIAALGEWMLREACALRARWGEALGDAAVAVNVSALQFRAPGFLASVQRALDDAGLAPRLLELELTESVIMAGFDQVKGLLGDLDRMGLKLSIDDFGTGYSSLSYLKRLPLDKLKIDRSFVIELPADPESRAIAAAVVGLARGLDMRVIAEGVETPAQAEFLRSAGCDEAQGFLYSKPLSPADFAARYVRGCSSSEAAAA